MILLTGGSGILGKELLKLGDFIAPTRKELDINSSISAFNWLEPKQKEIDCIVHCAAYTDVAKAEEEKELCYTTNVWGTHELAFLRIPMIYISTEYIFDGEKGNYTEDDVPNPRNFYALTKLLGEFEAKQTDYLIIRTLFKPRPFEHPAACVDQFTSGDYVDVIAKEIIIAIKSFVEKGQMQEEGIINIGTGRKSTFDLARQTRDVISITIESIGVRLPKDTSLDLTTWNKFKETL